MPTQEDSLNEFESYIIINNDKTSNVDNEIVDKIISSIDQYEKGIQSETSEHSETLDKLASGEISKEQAIDEIVKEHLAEKPNYYENYEDGAEIVKHKTPYDPNKNDFRIVFYDNNYQRRIKYAGTGQDSWFTLDRAKKLVNSDNGESILWYKNGEPMFEVFEDGGNLQQKTVKEKSFDEIRQSLDEFFTPKFLAKIMLELAIKHGFIGGKILEPSFGMGVFFDFLHDAGYEENTFYGFEIFKKNFDYVKEKYPKAVLINHNFEYEFAKNYKQLNLQGIYSTDKFQESEFDLVIGNPPYGKHKSPFSYLFKPELQVRYEGFFIYLALTKMKKGAILVFVINSLWLYNGNAYNAQKEAIFSLGELIDAYRLPNKIFVGENRDTSIATDIVIFRKK